MNQVVKVSDNYTTPTQRVCLLLLLQCIVVDCGLLPSPDNGTIIISETTFESVSTFSCNEGFNQSGSLLRTCQANGEWSGNDTICTSNN